ncbi:MAG: hypothetical protein L0170_07275, partial [Acidobacteria bacterium]|nr:hypothetical protein [Acidobacteriota bacterium]
NPETPGDLTFLIYHIIRSYVERKGLRFQVIAEVLGALSAADREFYRRVAAPYEDQKLLDNGDVPGDAP